MATAFAFHYGTDPRVDQIMEGEFVRRAALDGTP
jgi:hypothetical protein